MNRQCQGSVLLGKLTLRNISLSTDHKADDFTRTPWQQTLYSKKLIVPKFDETNWSGRGQHVEFDPEEASTIDQLLIPEGVLGHSSTALVEKVRCKRILLARKKIRCNWRVKKEDVIEEVAHLQRLSHAHIVRCVGTYIMGKELSILLYPATSYNLETFLERYVDLDEQFPRSPGDHHTLWRMREAIRKFFACLTNTIFFVHNHLIKHMDIKPSNFLVEQKLRNGQISHHIYLADFGIARSYENAVDVETDSRTPFSKTYAAPEVVRQDRRGFPAHIFSLGCVFLEMLAVLSQQRQTILDVRKRHPEGDSSYQANLKELRRPVLLKSELRVQPSSSYFALSDRDESWYDTTRQMLAFEADARPIAYYLTLLPDTECCTKGPKPFEAAPP